MRYVSNLYMDGEGLFSRFPNVKVFKEKISKFFIKCVRKRWVLTINKICDKNLLYVDYKRAALINTIRI